MCVKLQISDIPRPDLYETVFQCCGGHVYVLRVDCSNNEFAVSLYGMRAQHSLIDGEGHVRMARGKLLGAALMETVVQLQMQPPLILEVTEAAVQALQRTPSGRNIIEQAQQQQPSFLTAPSFSYPDQLEHRHHRRQPSVDPPSSAMPMHEFQVGEEATTDDSYHTHTPDYKDQVRSSVQQIPIVHGVAILADSSPASLSSC